VPERVDTVLKKIRKKAYFGLELRIKKVYILDTVSFLYRYIVYYLTEKKNKLWS